MFIAADSANFIRIRKWLMEQMDYSYCPKCGTAFQCKRDDITSCECNAVSLGEDASRFIAMNYDGCLCKSCLEHLGEAISLSKSHEFPTNSETFVQGVHYYIENGNWVFTETYHILRGSCCQSGCRHCPYGFAISVSAD